MRQVFQNFLKRFLYDRTFLKFFARVTYVLFYIRPRSCAKRFTFLHWFVSGQK